MQTKRLLTFELSADGDTLDVHMDREGLSELIHSLQRLADGSAPLPRHDHLATSAWAGDELTEERQSETSKLLNQVTLRLWR